MQVNIGRAFDLAGAPESTMVAYEKFLRAPYVLRLVVDAFVLAGVHKRLGELYDAKKDTR